MSSKSNKQLIVVSLAAAAVSLGLVVYFATREKKTKTTDKKKPTSEKPKAQSRSATTPETPVKEVKEASSLSYADPDKTPPTKNSSTTLEEKELHAQIEELDKKGKVLFKEKKYLEAAEVFTEALDLIEEHKNIDSVSVKRQTITLMNNRSAMYEKANQPELALLDCDAIVERDTKHTKARTRKLRILEGLKRWNDALIEICAIQLLFMQENRTNLRMGLPVPPPPVPQSKMEDILAEILPNEMEKYESKLKSNASRPLPSKYTILQLLKSYVGYNAWMAQAAKDGSVDEITSQLPEPTNVETSAKRASLLVKRGRRYVYEQDYEKATEDFEAAYKIVDGKPDVQHAMEGDDYARLLEWTGMARHWHYDLDSATEILQKCADTEPTNALILVKQAGVKMDAGKHEEAMKLFDTALGIDPSFVDALLHRSNLYLLLGKSEPAKKDLERAIELRPNHVMARLRLASILAAQEDSAGAKKQLDKAEEFEPRSSEVQSYRGELYFTQGEMDRAREQFEKAIKLEPTNPTPYVNAAMAVLNTPTGPSQMPDAAAVMKLLERAIDVDPQFTAAYIQLGQLKLGTATELSKAREVIALYDKALENCRSPEEIRELCSMRTLAVAQVDAATMLKMETFNMQ